MERYTKVKIKSYNKDNYNNMNIHLQSVDKEQNPPAIEWKSFGDEVGKGNNWGVKYISLYAQWYMFSLPEI